MEQRSGEPAPAPDEARIRRARVALGVSELFGLFVVGVVAQQSGGEPAPRLVGLFGALLLLAVVGAELIGLVRRRRWAIGAARPLLALLLLAGGVVFLDGLSHQTLNIPIVPLFCIWALWPRSNAAQSAAPLIGRDRLLAWGTFLVAAVALAWPVIGAELLKPGGPLISRADDLQATLELSCHDGVAPGDTVAVTYRWSWLRSEPLVGGYDEVRISWTGSNGQEEPSTPALLDDSSSGGTFQSDVTMGNGMGVVYGVDLGEQRFEPGSVALKLTIQPDAAGHGSINVDARYTRGATSIGAEPAAAVGGSGGPAGLWRSRAAEASCRW